MTSGRRETADQRPAAGRRTEMLACTLSRQMGSPIAVDLIELGLTGARVVTPRPLAIDETLVLALWCADAHASGQVRVVGQVRPDVYTLRFSGLSEVMLERLQAIVSKLAAGAQAQ